MAPVQRKAAEAPPSGGKPAPDDAAEGSAATRAPAGAQTAPTLMATENPLGSPRGQDDELADLRARVERLENLTGHRFVTATADEEVADAEVLATLPKTYAEAVRWQAAKDRQEAREASRDKGDDKASDEDEG